MRPLNSITKLALQFAKRDPLARFELLQKMGRVLVPNYRFKWPYMDWWDDPLFDDYLTRFNEKHGMNTDRRWMLYQLTRLVKNVPGDTAECGVYTGAGSYIICQTNQENEQFQRTHFLFDSFEGLSSPVDNDGEHWTAGDMSIPLQTVKKNLANFSDVSYHKGWIPDRFVDIEDRKFSFVHIDVDLFEPTLDSLKFFYPRMNEGGIILCDDYGFTTCPGATKAMDDFLLNRTEKLLSLCSGGGFLVKGIDTAMPLIYANGAASQVPASASIPSMAA